MSERLLFDEDKQDEKPKRYGFLGDKTTKAIADPSDKLDNALVFLDIDGLFADPTHRLPYYENKEWEKFYGASMAADTVHLDYTTVAPYLAGLTALYKSVEWVFLTGRPERTRQLCVLWLKQNIPFFANYDVENHMLMRDDDDHRVGFRVKWEKMDDWLSQFTKEEAGKTDFFFLDDDYRNIRYAYKKIQEQPDDRYDYLHGIVIGGGRLPSVHAVESTSDLGKD